MSEQPDLSGKTAIVTGASSGIGRAIAERLGASGAHVVLSGRTPDPMEQSAALITERGGLATVIVGDVRDPAAVQTLVGAAMEADGHVDIFVNKSCRHEPATVTPHDRTCGNHHRSWTWHRCSDRTSAPR